MYVADMSNDKVLLCNKVKEQISCAIVDCSSPWALTYFVLYLSSINHPDYREIFYCAASNYITTNLCEGTRVDGKVF